MTAKTERRLDVLESVRNRFTPFPESVLDSTTDAELAALRRRGVQAYRESDPDFVDLFL